MALEPTLSRGQQGTDKVNAALADAVTADEYTVDQLPAASAANRGKLVYCSDGANGAACMAYSNGTNWLRIVFGAAVSAT